MPISFFFGVINWESLEGLWLGALVAMSSVAIFFIYLGYLHYDWDKIAAKVSDKHREKVRNDSIRYIGIDPDEISNLNSSD